MLHQDVRHSKKCMQTCPSILILENTGESGRKRKTIQSSPLILSFTFLGFGYLWSQLAAFNQSWKNINWKVSETIHKL